MNEMGPVGKLMIVSGLVLAAAGVIIAYGFRWFPFGKLPGDIAVRKGNFSFFFPVVSCIIISILLSIILNLFSRR